MERLLSVSRELRDKVQQNESATGELLRQCEELREELKAMRQWREVVPSSEDNLLQMPNIEFKYIKQLQAENAELRVLLEEHQAAIEMIMDKYRQQMQNFMSTQSQEGMMSHNSTADELLHRTDQLYHMAAVISLSLQDDDAASQKTLEYVSQLEHENKHLRELLQFTTAGILDINDTCTTTAQTVCIEGNSSSKLESISSPSLRSTSTPPIPAFPKHLSGNGPASGPTWNRFPTRQVPRNPLLAMATNSGSGSGSGSISGTTTGSEMVGRPYEATPINSGQNTPTLRDPRFDPSEPLLEQARDRLASTIS